MSYLAVRDMMPMLFPSGKAGVITMMRCYFDDSGTHAGAPVVVWGGVAGFEISFRLLEKKWKALLNDPCEGHKPPISKFSLRDCANRQGEFLSNNSGESDRSRFLFRQAIATSGVRALAYAVSVADWDKIVTGRMRQAYGSADAIAFASCADSALKIAAGPPHRHMTCVFDKGQMKQAALELLNDAERRAEQVGAAITFTFSAVADSSGLQVADTVATEHYWYCQEALKQSNPDLGPHFNSLVRNVKTVAHMITRPQILTLRKKFRAADPDWKR